MTILWPPATPPPHPPWWRLQLRFVLADDPTAFLRSGSAFQLLCLDLWMENIGAHRVTAWSCLSAYSHQGLFNRPDSLKQLQTTSAPTDPTSSRGTYIVWEMTRSQQNGDIRADSFKIISLRSHVQLHLRSRCPGNPPICQLFSRGGGWNMLGSIKSQWPPCWVRRLASPRL